MHRVEANRVEVIKPSAYYAAMTILEDYITVSEFADSAGVSVQAIHKAMKHGRIKDAKRLGPVWLIKHSEIQRFKDSRMAKLKAGRSDDPAGLLVQVKGE